MNHLPTQLLNHTNVEQLLSLSIDKQNMLKGKNRQRVFRFHLLCKSPEYSFFLGLSSWSVNDIYTLESLEVNTLHFFETLLCI